LEEGFSQQEICTIWAVRLLDKVRTLIAEKEEKTMDFEFDEQQKMLQKAIRDLSRNEIAPLIDEAEKSEQFPVQLFSLLGESGYLCVSFPHEYGGAEMGKVEECIVAEEIGRVSLAISSSIMIQSGVATSAIKDHGSEDLKQRYLPLAITGQKIASFGLTEANAGSDALAIETFAKREGSRYIVNGSKTYITNGTICDFVTLAAYTDRSKGHRGMSLFVVDRDTPGFSCPKMHKFCVRASDTAELVCNDCAISEENLIGEEGRGFYYLMESLDVGRICHAASRLGAAQAAFEAALDYAKERVQFGRPIATFQTNAFKLSRMALEIESAKWMVYCAAWLYDQCRPCTKEASMAKLLASETYQHIAIEAMQIHGGAAALEEATIHRHYRDSYLGRITEGTSEIQELVIARQIGIRDIK